MALILATSPAAYLQLNPGMNFLAIVTSYRFK